MMARAVYRVLLRLHPTAFRERFASEMLWVFDVSGSGIGVALRDGLLSLLTQWTATDEVPRVSAPFATAQLPPFPTVRFAQATMVAGLLTLGFFKMLTKSVPLPRTPADFSKQRRAAWTDCRTHSHPPERYPGRAVGCRLLR